MKTRWIEKTTNSSAHVHQQKIYWRREKPRCRRKRRKREQKYFSCCIILFSFLHLFLSLHIHVQSVSIFFQNPPNTRLDDSRISFQRSSSLLSTQFSRSERKRRRKKLENRTEWTSQENPYHRRHIQKEKTSGRQSSLLILFSLSRWRNFFVFFFFFSYAVRVYRDNSPRE